MPQPVVMIRAGVPADAEELAAFGARTFFETFRDVNTPEDLAAYLDRTYGFAQQLAELTDADVRTLIAQVDGRMIGFAQLHRGTAPEVVRGLLPIELKRIYVDRQWHGAGVAQVLLSTCLDTARSLGGRTIWLGVWEHNPRALAFYTKHGFVDVGAHTFVLGSDHQTDRLMMREL